MNSFRKILEMLPPSITEELKLMPMTTIQQIEEIRLRCGVPVILNCSCGERNLAGSITKEELQQTLNNLIKFSYYAYQDDLAKGFVTIEGGHRVGICGKAVIKEGQPSLIKEISSMNIRFTKELKGCANPLITTVIKEGRPVNTLIVASPGCGKTTLLRDIARILSKRQIKVAICDERSEIAGMYNSVPSFDLGPRTDVIDGCDKVYGIPMLIRSMAPQVIITDEIGKTEDLRAAQQCLSSGVALITSIHGSCYDDIENSTIGPLLKKNFFKNLIFLSKSQGPGTIEEIRSA